MLSNDSLGRYVMQLCKKQKNVQWIAGFLLAALAVSTTGAPVIVTEDDLLTDIPMVTSVTHMDQTLLQAPASVTIIDRETIQASTAVALIDLFRMVPGFQSYFVNGARMGVTYHALGDEYPRRLEVKVDGRSVYESLFSSVDWSMIGVSLDDIEYIEIVRGANASADGSNAFLASINIVTRSPLLDSGWTFTSQLGSAETRNAALTYAGTIGAINHRTSLNFTSNDGFDDSFYLGKPLSVDDNSETFSATFRGLWTPTAQDNIEFQVGLSNSSQGIGKRTFTDRDLAYQYQYLNWSHLSQKGNKVQMILYHNDLEFTDPAAPLRLSDAIGVPDTSPYWPLPGLPDKVFFDQPSRGTSERWDLELRSTTQLSNDLRADNGAAIRYDNVQNSAFFDTPGRLSQTSYRAYTNLEWTLLPDLVLNGGLIVESHENSNISASYRVAANYEHRPDHIFRVVINRSFRAPTLLESNQRSLVRYNENIILDASVITVDDLDNEELNSYEIGYLATFNRNKVNLDVRLFNEKMTDVIGERRDNFPDLDNYVNIRDNNEFWDVRGAEVQLLYKPDSHFLMRGHYSYSDINGETLYRAPPALDIRDLDEYGLRHTAGLLMNYKFSSGISVSSMISHRSSTKYFRASLADAHTRVDLKAAKQWQVKRSVVDLSLTVQSVGDAYIEFYEFNTFGTRYIFGLRATLP